MLLEALFSSRPIFHSSDEGSSRELRLKVCPPRSLSDSAVWTEFVHLAARLGIEATGWRGSPIVGTFPRNAGKELPILKFRLKKVPNRTSQAARLSLRKESPFRVVAEADCAAGLACFLRLAAIDDPEILHLIPERWDRIDFLFHPGGRSRFRILGNQGKVETEQEFVLPRHHPPRAAESCGRVDLLHLSGPDGLYVVSRDNPRSRRLNVLFQLPKDHLSPSAGLAVCRTAAALALEATELTLPLAYPHRIDGESVVLEVREDPLSNVASMEIPQENPNRIVIRGSGKALAKALEEWISRAFHENGPDAESIRSLRDSVQTVRNILSARGVGGRWAHFLARQATRKSSPFPEDRPVLLPADPPLRRRIAKACTALGIPIPDAEPRLLSLARRIRWIPEQERVLALMDRVPRGSGRVTGTVFVSKPKEVRRDLQQALETALRKKGYRPKLRVLNAYKPGLCWLLEDVLPRLKLLSPPPSHLELLFAPFPADEKTMELRSRWLQEIHPGPDIVVRSLGLPADAFKFIENPNRAPVYHIRAWDASRTCLFKASLNPVWTRIPYAGDFPDVHRWVHPVTGSVTLEKEGKPFFRKTFPTDREVFWERFTGLWIPALARAMKDRWERAKREDAAVFWEEIRIRIAVDETDDPLDYFEERISPLEALHEDIYFVLLDFFQNFARSCDIPESFQLGQVIPLLFSRTKNGPPRASIQARPSSWPAEPNVPPSPWGEVFVSSLRFFPRIWEVELQSDRRCPPEPDLSAALLKILKSWGFHVDLDESSRRFVLRLPKPRNKAVFSDRKPSVFNTPPPLNRCLSFQETTRWIHELERRSNLRVWLAGKTSQGRPVWALETAPDDGANGTWSFIKRRFLMPTILFNARHHANEISSTQAALYTAWLAAHDPFWRGLAKDVNLVWIPMENVDGVSVFQRIHPTARGHMIHAARYNAAGCEFYADYFRTPPRFPDASAKRAVWERWLPEIILDAHGVPSHEWSQPFSGYIPGMFAEHWIPRVFLYAYIPFVNDSRDPRRSFAHAAAHAMESEVAADREIQALNEALRARYRRYAQGWEPDVFPPAGTGPLLVLPPVERVAALNFAVRKPQVTTLEVVTEVVDETAEGKWLELCARAHVLAFKGLIKTLRSRPRQAIVSRVPCRHGKRFVWEIRG